MNDNIGKKKFGHYEVVSELGRGGMGVVYKAWEPSLNRHVAIKALGEHLLNDEGLIERFTREAKSMAAINHPNVIQVFYIGKEERQPFFAMEFIEGQSLDDLLRGNRVLTVQHAKEILRQACAGLHVAHERDLVHRDIKPANLMVCDDGTVKVVDFGIAQTREYGDKLTNTGEFVGTPGYLSPEVCTGKEVDARSDIFALGIVFYEMLAGKVPFENDSPLGLMLEVVQSDIPDIRAANKKVDKKTNYILEKMIAKNPDERFQSCQEVMKHLGPSSIELSLGEIQKHAMTTKPEKKTSPVSQQVTMQAAVTGAETLVPSSKQKPNKAGWMALSLVAALGVGAVGLYEGWIPNPLAEKEPSQAMTLLSDSTQELSDVKLKSKEELAAMNQVINEPVNNQGTDQTAARTETGGLVDSTASHGAIPQEQVGTEQALAAGHDDNGHPVQNPTNQEAATTQNASVPSVDASHQKQAVSDATINTSTMVSVEHKPVHRKGVESKPAVRKNKGVAVLVFGDPAVANPIEKIIEAELKRDNIKVLNEQFVPGLSQVMARGADLAALREKLDAYGGQQMIIANVNHVGQQMLEYYGRQSVMTTAQLDVDSYDLSSGDSIGMGYGSELSYTSLNATETAQEAVMSFVAELKEDLKNQ